MLVDQGGVCQDLDPDAHVTQEKVQFLKSGVGEALPAGQGALDDSGVHRLTHQALPLVHGQDGGVPQLILHQVDVAHPAVQVAQGRQLELRVERNAGFPCLVVQIIDQLLVVGIFAVLPLLDHFQEFKTVCGFVHGPILSTRLAR